VRGLREENVDAGVVGLGGGVWNGGFDRRSR
jgi:hypothetical protein